MSNKELTLANSVNQLSEEVIADFKTVVSDAEALLKETANQGGDKIAALRTRAEGSLKVAKARLDDAQEAVIAKTRAAAKATDVYVNENPWKAVGIGAGVGLVIGLLIGRR